MTNHGHIPTLRTWWRFGYAFRPVLNEPIHGKFSNLLFADNGLNAIIRSLGSLFAVKTGSHEKREEWDFSLGWSFWWSWHSREVVAHQDKKTVRGSDDTTSANR